MLAFYDLNKLVHFARSRWYFRRQYYRLAIVSYYFCFVAILLMSVLYIDHKSIGLKVSFILSNLMLYT